jgi:hypothetical protein
MLLIAIGCFGGVWLKYNKSSTALKSLAAAEDWIWAGSAPQALRDALARLHVRYYWIAKNVITASVGGTTVFLFHFERSKGSERTSSTYKGIAVLVPGHTSADAPVLSIGQWPPEPMRKLVSLSPDLLDGVGSPAFRQRYYVKSADHPGSTHASTAAAAHVVPELEEELLSWNGTSHAGVPDGWSGIEFRDRQVMVYLNNTGDVSATAWHRLMMKAVAISGILARH